MLARVLILAAVVSWMTSEAVAAPPKGNAKEEQRERERIQNAEKEVREAKEKLQGAIKAYEAAKQTVQKAEHARDAASRHLQQVRRQLEEKHQKSSGMATARTEQMQAHSRLEQLSKPLLEALKQTLEYQRAVEEASLAKRELEEQASTSSSERLRELKDLLQRPYRLESAAIEADPNAKLAKEQVALADQALRAAKEKLERLVEADPELRKAQEAFAKAAQELTQAKQKASAEERDAAAAQARLAQATAHLNQVRQADRLDDLHDNKGNPHKKPKGKGK